MNAPRSIPHSSRTAQASSLDPDDPIKVRIGQILADRLQWAAARHGITAAEYALLAIETTVERDQRSAERASLAGDEKRSADSGDTR
jgi:hypothetical protein